MIVSYWIKTENGDIYFELEGIKGIREIHDDLMVNIEAYYPVSDYGVLCLNASTEEERELKKMFKEFYAYSWEYS